MCELKQQVVIIFDAYNMRKILSFFLLLMLLLCVGCAKQEESQNHIDNKNKNSVTLAAYREQDAGKQPV